MSRRRGRPVVSREELKRQVRAWCEAHYERVMEVAWDPRQYSSIQKLNETYERSSKAAQQFARTMSELRRLERMKHAHGWGLERATTWAKEALEEARDINVELPKSVRAWLVDTLEGVSTALDIEPDTRRSTAQPSTGPKPMRWWTHPKRRLSNREMAYITLLIGLEPRLQPGAQTVEDVIRAEANAIAQIRRRARRPE